MNEKRSQIAITGANGFVGRNIRKFLSYNNTLVISITRSKCLSLKCETNVRYSDLDQKNLIPKLNNCEALVHLIGQEHRAKLYWQAQAKTGAEMRLLFRILIMTMPLPIFYFALWFEVLDANTAGGLWLFSLMIGTLVNVFLWKTKPKKTQ